MNPTRFGIIGMGHMGSFHADMFVSGRIPEAVLTAVCDNDPETLTAAVTGSPSVAKFAANGELIRSGLVDAVLIATPHYAHTTIGIDALQAGLHVLMEKPISVHKADCLRLLAAHSRPEQQFGAMLNLRTKSVFRKARALLQAGELGSLLRVNWVVTDWFRSDAYYASSGWRATWAGEGGGVLLNQCTHQLDILAWLTGMPVRLRAQCGFGSRHPIEVEDQVTAMFEYANGATGVLITSTGEAPGCDRLEIVGERGMLTIKNNSIHFTRNNTDTAEFSRTSPLAYTCPDAWEVDIPLDKDTQMHEAVTRNFVRAIRTGEPLLAPAAEGIHAVELANAMLLSAWTDTTVNFPLDAGRYAVELQKRIDASPRTPQVTTARNRDVGHAPWMGK